MLRTAQGARGSVSTSTVKAKLVPEAPMIRSCASARVGDSNQNAESGLDGKCCSVFVGYEVRGATRTMSELAEVNPKTPPHLCVESG